MNYQGTSFDYSDWMRFRMLKQGIIWVEDTISEYAVRDLTNELEFCKAHNIGRVTIYLCSDGGEAYSAFGMYDVIKAYSGQVDIIAVGKCCSAAVMIILQAATKRIATSHTRFLLHEIRRWSYYSMDKKSDLEDTLQEFNTLHHMIYEAMKKRGVKNFEKLITRKENWIGAKEAQAENIIDEIIGE